MAYHSQKHTYLNKKKCISDIISGVILLMGTRLPYIFDTGFKYYSDIQNLLYVAQYTLTCLFGFIFLIFLVSRIKLIFNGEYIEKED